VEIIDIKWGLHFKESLKISLKIEEKKYFHGKRLAGRYLKKHTIN